MGEREREEYKVRGCFVAHLGLLAQNTIFKHTVLIRVLAFCCRYYGIFENVLHTVGASVFIDFHLCDSTKAVSLFA